MPRHAPADARKLAEDNRAWAERSDAMLAAESRRNRRSCGKWAEGADARAGGRAQLAEDTRAWAALRRAARRGEGGLGECEREWGAPGTAKERGGARSRRSNRELASLRPFAAALRRGCCTELSWKRGNQCPPIEVYICTHNPRREILAVAVDSIARQSVGPEALCVLLVDNASEPALPDSVLEPLRKAGIQARLVQESIPGISRARMRAVTETNGDWILFVDDDNELTPDYVAEGLAFIAKHPGVGCFGGKLLLPETLKPALWVVPYLPYLGIKDIGDKTLIGSAEKWEPWEPPTAGAFVCRTLLDAYRRQSEQGKDVFALGQRGSVLLRCEDSLIMRNSYYLNLANAYYPRLSLRHHLDPRRFDFRYLVRLLYGYGVSHVVLESILRGPQPVSRLLREALRFFAHALRGVPHRAQEIPRLCDRPGRLSPGRAPRAPPATLGSVRRPSDGRSPGRGRGARTGYRTAPWHHQAGGAGNRQTRRERSRAAP